jgi:hypothetical protein
VGPEGRSEHVLNERFQWEWHGFDDQAGGGDGVFNEFFDKCSDGLGHNSSDDRGERDKLDEPHNSEPRNPGGEADGKRGETEQLSQSEFVGCRFC